MTGGVAASPETIDGLLYVLDRITSLVDDPEHSRDADISEALARLKPLNPSVGNGELGDMATALTALPEESKETPSEAQQSEFPLSERVRSGWQQGRTILYGVKFDWYACEREFGISPIDAAQRLESAGTVLDSRVTLIGPSLQNFVPTPRCGTTQLCRPRWNRLSSRSSCKFRVRR